MPVHHGSRTAVHLVAAGLHSTTTSSPSNKKAQATSRVCESVENELKAGRVLKERSILLDGDGSSLHLLGDDRYMPFMMVRAGENLRQDPGLQEHVFHPDPVRNDIYAKLLRPDPSEALTSPQALALRVELSKQSFLQTEKPLEDIKIDILFNGQLTNSTMWPSRYFREERKKGLLSTAFGGIRFHWMLERAWVIVSRDQEPAGLPREPILDGESPRDRWQKIQDMLREEAEARGQDKQGNRTAVADYFTELSKVSMPAELETWCDSDAQKFGVIDVVLSYGHGKKDYPCKNYISSPTRLRNPRYRRKAVAKPVEEALPVLPELDLDSNDGRYGLRSSAVGKGTDNRRTTGGKFSSITVVKSGNAISSSQQLPKYLAESVTKAGYDLLQTSDHYAANTPSSAFEDTPSRYSPRIPDSVPFQSPAFTTTKYKFSSTLSPIPDVGEPMEADIPETSFSDVFSSSRTFHSSGQGKATQSFSSMQLGSSQESIGSQPQMMDSPFSSSMPEPSEGNLMPPPTLVEGLHKHEALDSPTDDGPGKRHTLMVDTQMGGSPSQKRGLAIGWSTGGSPRKIRRLAGSLPSLSGITAPEGSIGITKRGVFTSAGSPRDRSRFNSFSRNKHVDAEQVYAGSLLPPPPISPITPDRASFRMDPIVRRFVFKSQGHIFHSCDLKMPFRLSDVSLVAAHARNRAQDRLLKSAAPVLPEIPLNGAPVTPYRPSPGSSPGSSAFHSARSNWSTSAFNQTPAAYQTPVRPSRSTQVSSTPRPHNMNSQPQPPRSTPSNIRGGGTGRPRTNSAASTSTTSTGGYNGSVGKSSRRRRLDDPNHPFAQMERSIRGFVTPELSRDCAITYAQPRPEFLKSEEAEGEQWRPGVTRGYGGDVVRQIKSERGGEFEEDGIVFGVRFLVV